jgi:CDP-4-dehydro-6-deoxyglucose reductase
MSKSYLVSVGDTVFEVNEGESVSDAAERQGLRVRLSCRNGVCWVCEATVDIGTLHDASQSKNVGSGGVVRLCKSVMLSDATLSTNNISKPGNLPIREYACQVGGITPLSAEVYQVLLRLPAGSKSEFAPGQYLSINIPGTDPAYFSIASQPGNREIELHVQASVQRASALLVLNHLRDSLTVKVSMPFGKACLNHKPAGPVVLLGAGTGYAQLKSILDGLMQSSFSAPVYLFWGGRAKQDLYRLEEAENLGRLHANVEFYPVYEDLDDNDWSGHHAQLIESVLRVIPELAGTEVYVSGSPALVYAVMDAFEKQGLEAKNFYSDVLEYAPRLEGI